MENQERKKEVTAAIQDEITNMAAVMHPIEYKSIPKKFKNKI
jgi:hypothetical protein